MELTAEELAMLTPEELAGMNEGQGDEGDENNNQGGGEDGQGAAAGNGGNDADAGAAAAADAAADAGAAAADQANADGAAAAGDQGAADAPAPRQFQPGDIPLIRPGQTDNAEARTTELEGQLDSLAEKFDNGDITTADFLKQQRNIHRELNKIEQEVFRTSLATEAASASQQRTWEQSVSSFLNGHPELGDAGSLRLQAYDFALRRVTGDEANAGKSDAELLEMARQNWAKELGITLEAAAKKEPPAQQEKPATKSATDRPAAPSLASVPAADNASVDDGKFASLDRLMASDPIAFEAQLARLSPADQEAYLQYAG